MRAQNRFDKPINNTDSYERFKVTEKVPEKHPCHQV